MTAAALHDRDRTLLTAAEVSAHLAIVDGLDMAKRYNVHHSYILAVVEAPLRQFRPRCPSCRDSLQFGPWNDGSRFVACRCGVSYRECSIRFGASDRELERREGRR